jgi:GMP synthase (glutamine-hydrolysing)
MQRDQRMSQSPSNIASANTEPASAKTSLLDGATDPLTAQRIVVLDFGSQYAQLIARRVRDQNVYCQILRHDITADRIAELKPKGIILSGGPASVYEDGAPRCDPELFKLGIPVLGICYGMQLTCDALGGEVANTTSREYGRAACAVSEAGELFADMPAEIDVWMSHGDQISSVADAFETLAATPARCDSSPRTARLWNPVSSRSYPHAAGRQVAGKLCDWCLPVRTNMETR